MGYYIVELDYRLYIVKATDISIINNQKKEGVSSNDK